MHTNAIGTPMPILTCIGRDGIPRTFEYRFSQDILEKRWTFTVTTIPPPVDGHFFELLVAEQDQNTVRVEMANHHGRSEYAGRGIPEALLPIVKRTLGMEVESSPSHRVGNVIRMPAATKYWDRLCAVGGARYDVARDVYSVL
jgi:hypothetical protein